MRSRAMRCRSEQPEVSELKPDSSRNVPQSPSSRTAAACKPGASTGSSGLAPGSGFADRNNGFKRVNRMINDTPPGRDVNYRRS